ncbi:MAG: hypothetical protein Q9178_004197 [Gyalolechia marmorata]
MAVGAHVNRIVIYALKGMDRIRKEVQTQDGLNAKNFMPIQQVHSIRHIEANADLLFQEIHAGVNGSILKMEFLHPSKGDEYHVILLLVVSKGKITRLVRFEWDSRSSLSEIDRKPSQVLADSERVPLLLIPLTYGTSFALVCEHQITVFKDILTGNAKGQAYQLEHYEPPEEPGSSKGLPIWTQWARPMRPTERGDRFVDNIYLCREDGVVRYIDIKENSHPMISSDYSAGILNTNLGSAFAALDLGDESNDLLIAAGEMADGGMWYFEPRKPLELVGTIRNWTPLRDIAAAHVTTVTSSHVLQETKRLFACSGRGPRHGVVTEIRKGVEAVKLGPTVELGQLAENGILDLWALPDRSNTGIYLMIAQPAETELILLPSSPDQDPQAASETGELDLEELDLDERTIAAGSTAEGFLVQVTPSSVNAIAQEHGILPLAWRPEGAFITAASFLTIPTRTTMLLVVLQRHEEFYLHHGHIGSQGGRIVFEELGESVLLQSEASSVSLHWIKNRIIAFVGTLAATLRIYTTEAGSGFGTYFEYSFDDPFSICDSLAVITTKIPATVCEETEDGQLVVCGLRNGTVRTLWFNEGGDEGSHGGERDIFELLSPGAPLSTGTIVQRRALHPAIAFVDPDAEPTRVDQGERDMLNLLKADDVARGEKFLGILEWFPTDGKKQYHMLVIHTVIGQAGSQEAIGRLLFFSPYLNDDNRIKQKIILDHEAEISAVATHGDSSLVYGCGNDILFRFLNLEEKKFKQTMKVTLRSPAVHISVQGANIHVSTESHGHHILSISEDGLTARWAERTSRISAHHIIALEMSLIITTDFQCRVAGLWQPPRPQLDRTAPLIFEALLPRSITRLCRMPRHVWQKKRLEEDAILGTSEDGTIYQLSLLDEASWRLLAYIQNMAMREPRICPYPDPRVRERDIEPSMARKQNMHIDGDKLIRLLERGSRRLLEEMLAEDGTQDRRDRLAILAIDAFKDKKPNGDIVESVLGWIRSLLLPAI